MHGFHLTVTILSHSGIQLYSRPLDYLSLRFLLPPNYNWNERYFLCGTHSIFKKFNSSGAFQKLCYCYLWKSCFHWNYFLYWTNSPCKNWMLRGLSRLTVALLLKKTCLFKVYINFHCRERHMPQNIHLRCLGVLTEISETDISQPGQTKPRLHG